MSKKVATVADQAILDQLADSYPQEEGPVGIFFPRISLRTQDKVEEVGKGRDKKIKVIEAAGEFSIDRQTDEIDPETKKNVWEKEEIGDSFEGIIFYRRHQLKMYDEATEKYTSSHIFDSNDEVVKLFCDGKEVAHGLPEDLKAQYKFTDKNGKEKSALEDTRIVYVYKDGEAYQMNLRGSSMYSLLTYERSVKAPTVLTEFSSEEMEKGDIRWNKMTFRAVRQITPDEANAVIELGNTLRSAIEASKASYSKPKKDDDDEEAYKMIGTRTKK